MCKLLKRILIVVFFMVCGLALIGCKMGGDSGSTTDPNGNQSNTPTLAKLDSSKQGLYYGDDVVVEILESSVKVTDPSGKTLTYDIYQEDGKYYILEEGRKVYCTFGDGTVTNEKGTFTKKGGSDTPTLAKLDSAKQGLYYGDDVVVEVLESSVKVTDPTGKTLTYSIYQEGNKYYILEEGRKVYCTFGDGTVTNEKGTFTKKGGSDTPTLAKIPSTFQGDYFFGPIKLTVYESKIIVNSAGETMEYNLYQDNKGNIYIVDDGEQAIVTIGEDGISVGETLFTREEATITASQAAANICLFLGVKGDFRVPDGASITEATMNGEGSSVYIITVVNPKEDVDSYREFLTTFFTKAGYTSIEGSMIRADGSLYYGIGIDYESKTGTLIIAATKYTDEPTEVTTAADFVRAFKNISGITLTLPDNVKEFTNVASKNEEYNYSISGWFVLEGVANPTKDNFEVIVSAITGAFEAKGFNKGEVIDDVSGSEEDIYISWDKDYGATNISLSLYITESNSIFRITYSSIYGPANTEWPASDIASFFANKVKVPEFVAEFQSISANRFTNDGVETLMITALGATKDQFDAWVAELLKNGFAQETDKIYRLRTSDDYLARIYPEYSEAGMVIHMMFEKDEIKPWPTSFIKEKMGEAVAEILPEVTTTGVASFNATFGYDTLTINVEVTANENAYEAYVQKLIQKGFVQDGFYFTYVFENYDSLEVHASPKSESNPNSFEIDMYLTKYEAMEYILPDNFVIEVNENGFRLVKVGESYVYEYTYGGVKQINVYLYDAAEKKWINGGASMYAQQIVWKEYGPTGNTKKYQYVDRPILDEFLASTSGLAYSYYKNMLEAETVTKDASKNATIAGVLCEYHMFKSSVSFGSGSYTTTTELWIDPVTKMIFKVDYELDLAGSVNKSTPFEIKAIDKTKTTLKDAGIANCMLPTFDPETATDNDHLYGEKVTTAATCGAPGEEYVICSCCGAKKVISSVPATGEHTPYMEGGEIAWFTDYEGHHSHYCTVCKTYYGVEDCHFGEWFVERTATCSHEGYRYRECTVCGYRESENTAIDPNHHDFVGYYNDNVTVVLPTKEAAGSITWACLDNCGAKKTYVLPILSEDNYVMGVYYDFFEEKYYTLYGFNLDKMLKDINTLLDSGTSADEMYLTYTVLSGINEFTYNYDENNPLYGFIGDEVQDEIAEVNSKYRDTYYNDEGAKLVVGVNTIALTIGDNTATYTLYTRDGDIYYTNSEEEKVFLSFDEEVGIYLGEDYFFKLVAANLDNSLRGKFVDEETGTTIDVKASYVTVTPLEGESTGYDIYEKDGSYFIIYENEIKYCEIYEDSAYFEFGSFAREGGGEEEEEGFPLSDVAEYLGFNDFVYFTYDEAEYSSEIIEEEGYDLLYVYIYLPEVVNAQDVLESFISECEGYGEYGYVAPDYSYQLFMSIPEGENYISCMYLKISE